MTDFYITIPGSKHPHAYAANVEAAEQLLIETANVHPGARMMTCDQFSTEARAETLKQFPLSRVSSEFHDTALNVLPPIHRAGTPGFFVSEAVMDSIYAQFLSHNGRFYGGYADLSKSGKCWSIADVIALEAGATDETPTLDWYPES